MKTRLVNKDIRQNYTNELLKERGLTDVEIEYFLSVPDARYLQSPLALNNITLGLVDFEHILELGADNRIVIVVD